VGALGPASSAPPPGRTWKLAGYRRPNLAAMFTTFTTFTQAPGSDPLLMSSCQDHPGKWYLRLDFAHNQEAIQVSGNGRFATARHFPSSGGRGNAGGVRACPLSNGATNRGVSNSRSTLLAPSSYFPHKNAANKFRNAVIAFALRNFPKSSVLVSTKSNTDLLFSPSELHLRFAIV